MATENEDPIEQYADWKAPESFESQYDHKEEFVINGAKVESVDIKPEHQKDEVPVLVAPGYGATIESFKPGLEVLANRGRRSISLDTRDKAEKFLIRIIIW